MDVKDMMPERKQHRYHRLHHQEIDSQPRKTDDEASVSSAWLCPDEDYWSISAATPLSSGPPSGELSFEQLIASPVPFDEDADQETQSDFLAPDQLGDYDATDSLLLRERDEAGNAFPFTLLSTIEEEDEEMVASEPDSTDQEEEGVDRGEDAPACKRQPDVMHMLQHHLSISDVDAKDCLMMESSAFQKRYDIAGGQ